MSAAPPHPETPAGHPLPILDDRIGADEVASAVCPYCGVGCVLKAEVDHEANRVTRVWADSDAAPNFGMMCPKGALVKKIFDADSRLTQPMLRDPDDGKLKPVAWQTAIRHVAQKLTEIKEKRGPNRIAWYGSGQLDTEASYVFTKFFKGHIGTNHTDTNSRLCMSSAVAGYHTAFGSDGPPTCYNDIEHADAFFIIGANMAANHPVLFNMVRRRRATNDHVKIIVVDPRKSKTADFADVHVPVRPGGDVALLQLIAKRLSQKGLTDHAFIARHTDGGSAYLDHLIALDEDRLLEQAGIDRQTLDACITAIGRSKRLLSFYCMGVNQSTRGTDNNTQIINLHLLRGAISIPGAGPFSLTGQPNAMGGREVGYLAHQLPGYRFVTNPDDRKTLENAWNIPAGSINPTPGHTAVDLFNAAHDGEIDALWIACTNPTASMPDASRIRQAMRRVGLVVVQDITADSEAIEYADVVFPATQWGEKTGTMTNSERLVVRSKRFLDPPGQAMPDWWIPAAVAREMGGHGFAYTAAAEIWDEFRSITAGTRCDMAGMTNKRLNQTSLRWPCPDTNSPGTPRRYADGKFATPNRRARFTIPRELPDKHAVHEPATTDHPFTLTTGRVASQWHTRTKTRLVPELNAQEPHPFVEVHPDDAADAGIQNGAWMWVHGLRGSARGIARYTPTLRRGLVFMPFHWADGYDPSTNVNTVTNPAYCPQSKQPELKAAAVSISPAVAPGPDEKPSQKPERSQIAPPPSQIQTAASPTASPIKETVTCR